MKIISFFVQHKSSSYIFFCILLLFLFSPTTLHAAEDSIPAPEHTTGILEEPTVEAIPTEIAPELPTQENTVPEEPNEEITEEIIIEVPAPELPPQDNINIPPVEISPSEESFDVESFSGIYYITSSGGLNVRRGPSTSYDIIGSLPYGKEISITGKVSNDWFEISYQGTKGYISAKYVSPEPAATTPLQTAEGLEEIDSVIEETEVDHGFTPFFTDAPLFLLFLSIVAVIVLIVITVFSFFHHNYNSEQYYDDDFDYNYDTDDTYDYDNSSDNYNNDYDYNDND